MRALRSAPWLIAGVIVTYLSVRWFISVDQAPLPSESTGPVDETMATLRDQPSESNHAPVSVDRTVTATTPEGTSDNTELEAVIEPVDSAASSQDLPVPQSWDPVNGMFDEPSSITRQVYFNPEKKRLTRHQHKALKELVADVRRELSLVDESIRSKERSELERKVAVGDVTRVPKVPTGQRYDFPRCPYPPGKYGVRVRVADDPSTGGKLIAYVPGDTTPSIRQAYEERENFYHRCAEDIRRFFLDIPRD